MESDLIVHSDKAEERKAYQKAWYNKTKDVKIPCECGGAYTQTGKPSHIKSKSHTYNLQRKEMEEMQKTIDVLKSKLALTELAPKKRGRPKLIDADSE